MHKDIVNGVKNNWIDKNWLKQRSETTKILTDRVN